METIIYDYSKLKGKVREVFGNNKNFADFLGISEASLYEKYNSNSYFNQNQMIRIIYAFKEDAGMIMKYFFKEKVEKNTTKEESE